MSMYPQLESTRVSHFLFIFVIFFSALSSTGIADEVDDTVAAYMSELLKALTPTPPGWSQNTNYCQWNGVNCIQPSSGGGPLVKAILLPSSSLSGELPQHLYLLYSLTHLDLHNNSLTGPIPSLAGLSSLETVYLGHNNFTSIPYGCFEGLKALQTLNLSNNSNLTRWSFPTELAQSPLLRTFDLAGTNVASDLLPAGMFDWFPSLQSVDLSSNYIGGSLPESLGRSRIRYLRLNGNQFMGPIPDLSSCTDLSVLQLEHNGLTGFFPPWLMALPSLQNVSLDDNFLIGPIPVLSRKGVKGTWKSNNFCRNDSGPCDPRVTTLLEIAVAFGYPPKLAVSWKGNDPCEKRINSPMITITVCKVGEIVRFDIGKMNYSGTISPAFANLTSLRNLTLSGNNLTGIIPQSLTSLSQLEVLDVSNNDLSGQVPNFSPKVKVIWTGNDNLVGPSQGVGDPSLAPVSGHTANGGPLKTPNGTSLSPVWITARSGISVECWSCNTYYYYRQT